MMALDTFAGYPRCADVPDSSLFLTIYNDDSYSFIPHTYTELYRLGVLQKNKSFQESSLAKCSGIGTDHQLRTPDKGSSIALRSSQKGSAFAG